MENQGTDFSDNQEINEYIREYQITKDETKKKRLSQLIFLACSPLIKKTVHSFARRSNDPFDDLFQVGSIGLVKAIELFNLNGNTSFKTYANYLITGEIKHYLRDKSTMIKAPREMRELSFRLNKIINELTDELGEAPSDEIIAKRLQVNNEKMQEVMNLERRTTPISIDKILDDTDSENSAPKDVTDAKAIEEYKELLADFENRIILKESIDDLDEDLKEVIRLHFFEGYSQAQIAQKLGTNPMNISRKVKRALNELLQIITKKGLNKYD